MKSAMLEEAHKALEAMSVAANAMKDEEWGEAERALMTVQELYHRLKRSTPVAGVRFPGRRVRDSLLVDSRRAR
jgi:hypothetical protein